MKLQVRLIGICMDIKREEGKKLVLEIGPNIKPQAHLVIENAKIYTMDIDKQQKPDIVMDAGKMNFDGKFDVIFASHVLEHFPYWDTIRVLTAWKKALVSGGELHIVVPSWEWAARQVLMDNPSPALFPHSFAGIVNEWDVHKVMFTMRSLRMLFDKIELNTIFARTGKYKILVSGKEVESEQHYIIGVKQ